MTAMIVLFLVAVWAGVQNALAGGGTFLTLPALMLTGMTALAANITSTVALFPGQITSSWGGRRHVAGAGGLPFRALVIISLLGGVIGAVLLLVTPSSIFARMVPWLVLFATAVFAWGSLAPRRESGPRLNRLGAGLAQFLISVYGGYFGGGIGFLMLAALTAAGLTIRHAGATKNVLAGVMNASAVAIFVFSPQLHWMQAAVACAGAVIGGWIGGHMISRVNEKVLRAAAIAIGVALTIGLFIRAP
ncbi:MAG: transporter [Alphaproteobacteria bacterium 64-11]|nr:sulfite exporter TauE/SafE family protein [Alphaproteobacteria bacterium]OJU13885.1 MAG: transporter [Alphaproteobacteria bacterium 64-11]